MTMKSRVLQWTDMHVLVIIVFLVTMMCPSQEAYQHNGQALLTPMQTLRPGMRFEHQGLMSGFQHMSCLMVKVFSFREMMSQQVSPFWTM